jgi:hypothetical protein
MQVVVALLVLLAVLGVGVLFGIGFSFLIKKAVRYFERYVQGKGCVVFAVALPVLLAVLLGLILLYTNLLAPLFQNFYAPVISGGFPGDAVNYAFLIGFFGCIIILAYKDNMFGSQGE